MTPEPGLTVHNVVAGGAGGVVQTGVVHGDVHLHAAPPPLAPLIPRQLPAPPKVFAGRVTELAALDHALTATPRRTRR
jgi:hypothetical protein